MTCPAHIKKGVKGASCVPLTTRFWAKVDRRGEDECWPWLGAATGGYGAIRSGGRNLRATRLSWSLHHGMPFPAHLDACHTCDNPRCVNPRHIWPGTASANARDAVAKGRLTTPQQRGLAPWQLSLTHCKRGHPFDEANTLRTTQGSRSCRICLRMHQRNYRARQYGPLKAYRGGRT